MSEDLRYVLVDGVPFACQVRRPPEHVASEPGLRWILSLRSPVSRCAAEVPPGTSIADLSHHRLSAIARKCMRAGE